MPPDRSSLRFAEHLDRAHKLGVRPSQRTHAERFGRQRVKLFAQDSALACPLAGPTQPLFGFAQPADHHEILRVPHRADDPRIACAFVGSAEIVVIFVPSDSLCVRAHNESLFDRLHGGGEVRVGPGENAKQPEGKHGAVYCKVLFQSERTRL